MNSILKISACCITDTGLVRANNEDTCLINKKAGYFLVADGMGGAAAGEKASALFREVTDKLLSSHLPSSRRSIEELLVECFHAANKRILSHALEVPSCAGMGCTGELLIFSGSTFVLGHVGDSRTYCLREGRLELLTTDHTFIQEQQNQGLLSEKQALKHPMRNLILRVIGGKKKLEVDIVPGSICTGDIFLLCSDGLTDMVEEMQLQELLSLDAPLKKRAAMLIDRAKTAGGKDNITVALIELK